MGGGDSKEFSKPKDQFGDPKKINLRSTIDTDTICVEDKLGQFLCYRTNPTGAFAKFCFLLQEIIEIKKKCKADLGLFNENEENDENYSEDISSSSSESTNSDEDYESAGEDLGKGGISDDADENSIPKEIPVKDRDFREEEEKWAESDIEGGPKHNPPSNREIRYTNQSDTMRQRGATEKGTLIVDSDINEDSGKTDLLTNDTNTDSWLRIKDRKTFQMFVLFQTLGGADNTFFEFIKKNGLEMQNKPSRIREKWTVKDEKEDPDENSQESMIKNACGILYNKFSTAMDQSLEYNLLVEDVNARAEILIRKHLRDIGIDSTNIDSVLNKIVRQEKIKLFENRDEGSYKDVKKQSNELSSDKNTEDTDVNANYTPPSIQKLISKNVPPLAAQSDTIINFNAEGGHQVANNDISYKLPSSTFPNISGNDLKSIADFLRLCEIVKQLKVSQVEVLENHVKKEMNFDH